MINLAERPLPEEVGGKAASLLRLQAGGWRVPPFFVVPAAAHRSNQDGRVPPALAEQIIAQWRVLGGESNPFAVRSSGIAEDSADNSFAGVFTTVLDVRGEEALIAAVEACWASHGSAEAAAYRAARGVASDEAMAVVVQRMIEASWSGVCFTADPLTQALSVTVVNAVRGGADKLVSGLVNPDNIHIDARTGKILDRSGAWEERLPQDMLDEVLSTSAAVAEAYDFPQDIEWAFDRDGMWLLQSRPITTVTAVCYNRHLEPWGDAGDPDAPDRVWTRAYADEIWSPPVSPLFYDVQHVAVILTDYLTRSGDDDPTPPDIFKYYRAAAYCDVAPLERMYACLPPLARRPGVYTLFPAEMHAALRAAPWRWRGLFRRLWLFEVEHGASWGITRNHKFLNSAWPGFLARARELGGVDVTALDEAGLESHTGDIWELAGTVGNECGVAVLYYAHDIKLLLSGLLERWCGEGEDLYGAVSAGLSASETVREADRIWEIADELRNSGSAAGARELSWSEFKDRAQGLGAAAGAAAFESFLSDHPHRGANYKDLVHPRWGDDPELLWAQVRAFLEDGARPSAANAASAERRRAAQRQALASVTGVLAPLRRGLLRALFHYNEVYSSLRDNHRYYYDHVWWLLRRTFVEKGRRLLAAGRLQRSDDIFFLNRPEIAELSGGALPVEVAAARIAVRRGEWDTTRRRQPPKFLRRGYAPDDGGVTNATEGRLTGLPASPGQARGRARVVYDISELSRVAPGEILVTRQTDPSWTPVFSRLGGLVLETGGVLAHGASLCREFGLPCVTALQRATEHVRDGQMIAIDGAAGTVDLL